MNDEELLRYSRHILLPELDLAGQEKLLDASVLIVGLGGLGSPAAMYLAASGVGSLLLADGDVVELSNLQRQVVHRTASIGQAKASSAAMHLRELNPSIRLTEINERVGEDLLARLVPGLSLVLDCSDNLATRYLINRICMREGVPLVSAAALGWEGQLAVFDPRQPGSPCYRCLYPQENALEERSCALSGVAAPVVGVMGLMQALEALKLIANAGETLLGELLVFDGLRLEWHRLRVTRNPLCPVCADRPQLSF